MRVFVKTVDSETITIHISPEDTVIILKIRIKDETGIEPRQQKLIFAGKTLSDDRSLGEYYITNDSIIHMIKDKRVEGKMTQIFIKALSGNVISVDVAPSDTVADIKHKIQTKDGIPAFQQQLIFSGKSLSDHIPVGDYNIQQHSTVHLVMKSGQHQQVDQPHAVGGHTPTHSNELSTGGLTLRPTSGPHPSPRPVSGPHEPLPGPYPSPRPTSGPQAPSPGSNSFSRPTSGPQPTPRNTSGPHSSSGLRINELVSITCMTESRRTIKVNVRLNETIANFKERLAVKEGIVLRQNDIILRVNGSNAELRDHLTLSACGIHLNTLLNMEVVPRNVCTLFIKTLNGKTFILYPMESVLVSHIKAELAEKSNIPANQQRLVYQGSDLPDHQTLAQCGVPPQCTLHVIQTHPPVANNRPKLPLLVKTLVGKAITVYITEGNTVGDVKDMISTREGYPKDEISIMMGGVELHDAEVLDYYQIQQGSTLLVTFKVKNKLKLQIHDVSRSKTLLVDGVLYSDTIGDVVNRVSSDIATPTHAICLVLNGQVLRDEVSVDQCEITENTIITLHLLKPKSISVNVKTVAGLQCRVNLSSFERVSALKSLIEATHGVPSNEQVLVCKGQTLHDDMYICDAIASPYMVRLFTRMGINRNIAIKLLPTGRITQYNPPTETTIEQVKRYIGEDHAHHVSLMYNGMELQPVCCLGDYLILDGAQILANIHSHEALSISIQPDNGESAFTLITDATESVRVFRMRVAGQVGVSVDRLALCYCGVYMSDDRVIRDYRLPETCVILVEIQS